MRLNIAWDVLSYKISQTRAKVARSGVEMLVSLWNSIGACCWGACQISKQLENSNQVFLFSSYYILGQSCWFSVTTALLRKLYRMASHCIVLFRVQFVFNSYWFATRMQCEFSTVLIREGRIIFVMTVWTGQIVCFKINVHADLDDFGYTHIVNRWLNMILQYVAYGGCSFVFSPLWRISWHMHWEFITQLPLWCALPLDKIIIDNYWSYNWQITRRSAVTKWPPWMHFLVW